MKVITGVVLLGLMSTDPCPGDKKDGSGRTPPATVKAFEVKIEPQSCKATIDGDKKFKKSAFDVIVMKVSNSCDTQKVVICALLQDNGTTIAGAPWDTADCHGLSPENLVPGTPFEIKKNSSTHAICGLKAPGKYCVYAFSGASPTCPAVGTACPTRGSEIAIEVEP